MRLVMYLSGRTGMSKRFHREEDSVADSVQVPKRLRDAMLDHMKTCGVFDEDEPKKWDPVPTVSADAMLDMFSDLEGETEHPLYELREDVIRVCSSECSCGYLWVVDQGAI